MKRNILTRSCVLIFIFLAHTYCIEAQPAAPVVTPYVVACGNTAFNINAVPPLPSQQVRWYNNFYMQTLLFTGNTYSGTATQSQTFYASTYDPGTGLQSPYPATAYVFVPKPPVVHATAGIDPVSNCLGAINTVIDTAIDSVSIVDIADAYVVEATPSTNFGTLPYMIVWACDSTLALNGNAYQYYSYLYMKFNLSQIPPNVNILSSKLTMTDDDAFAWGGDGNIYSQFVSDDSWTETGLTWYNKPSTAPFTATNPSGTVDVAYMYWVWGADYSFAWGAPATGGTGYTITTWTSPSASTAIGLIDTGLLASTQSEYAGDKTLSFAMESPGYNTRWYTKEYTGNEAQIPHLNVHFTYNGSNTTYSWVGPNGYTSTQESPASLLAGTYTLTVTNAYSCTTTTTVTVTNVATNTTVADTFCTGSSFTYAGHTYTTGGTYTNTFTNIHGCDSTVTLNLYALPQPTVTATNNSPMCINGTNILNLSVNTSPGATYSWTGPNGFTSAQQNPQISNLTPAASGTYYVTVTLPTGCTATGTTVVVISPGAPLPIVYDMTYCQYDVSVPLNAIGNNLLWYNTPTGGIGDTVVPVPSTQNVGTSTWYVTQTAPNGCISFRAPINVTVNFKAKFNIVADSAVCLYDSTSFTYNGTTPPGGASYTWSTPRTTIITGTTNTASVNVRFDSIGNHEILLAVADDSAGLCKSVDSQNIYVAPPPVANFTMPTDGCAGQTINVVVTNGTPDITYNGYTWNFNDADVTSGTVPGPGPYTATYAYYPNGNNNHNISLVAVSRYGCVSDTTTDTINIHPSPTAFIDSISSLSVCTGDTVSMQAAYYDPQNNYEWTPRSAFIKIGQTDTAYKAYAIIASSTDIYLTVTSPYGCKDSSDIPIAGQSCCGVYFPTAFSPGSTINNKFRPITVGHHNIQVFRIVNRWGQTVYASADENAGWDGTLNGVPQEIGDYFWYIKYQCSNGNITEEKGTVTLIR